MRQQHDYLPVISLFTLYNISRIYTKILIHNNNIKKFRAKVT